MLFHTSHCTILPVICAVVTLRVMFADTTPHGNATISTKDFSFKHIITFRIFFCFFQFLFMLLRSLFIHSLYRIKEFFRYNRLMHSRNNNPFLPRNRMPLFSLVHSRMRFTPYHISQIHFITKHILYGISFPKHIPQLLVLYDSFFITVCTG